MDSVLKMLIKQWITEDNPSDKLQKDIMNYMLYLLTPYYQHLWKTSTTQEYLSNIEWSYLEVESMREFEENWIELIEGFNDWIKTDLTDKEE
jgi:hypothetical protein